jgi:hypothetical protein
MGSRSISGPVNHKVFHYEHGSLKAEPDALNMAVNLPLGHVFSLVTDFNGRGILVPHCHIGG